MSATSSPHVVHRVTTVPFASTGGLTSPAPGNLRLAAEHFGAATLYMLAGAVGLVWIAPRLASGDYLSPSVAAITHLFTLGWLTITIFGALYQLLPVALGTPLRWPRAAHVSSGTLAPGVGVFVAGVATNSVVLHHAGIALVGTGVVIGVVNVAATLARVPKRDVTWAAIALAITFLSSTLVLGVVLVHNLHTGAFAAARVSLLATHLHVAIVGWALVMMVGVSHRLLPMFLLAHGADTRWTRRSIALLTAGVVALVVGIDASLTPLAWLGALCLEAGIACFLFQAHAFHRVRVRKHIDVGMRFAAAALAFLSVAAVLGPVLLARGRSATHVATAYVLTGLLGGVLLYVVGFSYKIIPLLAWTARYSAETGTGRAPAVADLFSARLAHVQLVVMITAVAVLAAAILLGLPSAAYVGALLFLIGAALHVSQIACVALGGRAAATS